MFVSSRCNFHKHHRILDLPCFIAHLMYITLYALGTPEEKGTHWREEFMEHGNASPENEENAGTSSCKVYDLPFGMNSVTKRAWTRFIPFCPTFKKLVKLDANDKYEFEPITSK